MSDPRDERTPVRGWEQGWEGHRDAQARRLAALSLGEKLDWLEEAQARVRHMRGGTGLVRDAHAGPDAGVDHERPADGAPDGSPGRMP